jgi:hypothetical protein
METRSSHPRETARSLELSHLAAHAGASPSVPRLASSIRALRSTLQRVVGKSVRLSLDIEPGVGDAQVDRDELARVLVDLATNARDAMAGVGHLTIAMRDITALDAAYVGVFVADDGAGISPDVVCRLFKGPVTTKQAAQVTYTLTADATVTYTIRCAGSKACASTRPARASQTVKAGNRAFELTRRQGGKLLPVGKYTLTLSAGSSTGSATFVVK